MRQPLRLLSMLACLPATYGFCTEIQLRAASFDPLVDVPRVAGDLRAAPGAGYFLVQLTGPASAADFARLRAVGIAGYVPSDTYILRLDASQIARVAGWPNVRWVGPVHPAYKLSPDLGRVLYQSEQRRLESAFGIRRMVVTLFPGESVPSAVRAASAAGVRVSGVDRIGSTPVLETVGSEAGARALARYAGVKFIEESGEATYRNGTTTWVIQANVQGSRPIWAQGLYGEGQVGGLIDGALYTNHFQFRDPNGNPIGPTHRKVLAYNGSTGSDSHGTHTAGTFWGDMEPMNGQTTNNGSAPKAKGVFTNLSSVNGSNLYTRLLTAYTQGAKVHSNSWGNDSTVQYDAWCRAIDQFTWEFEDSVVAFAVTNTSTLRNPENAKNVLAVGASQQAPNQHAIGSGGRGPTNDGRRKPEIFSPGININSARNGTDTSFVAYSGTSMACPSISGSALLVRQYFQEGFWKNGVRDLTYGITPTGALIRATMMNAGVDMTGVAGYPTNNEGWGRLLLDNSLWFQGDARRLVHVFRYNLQGLTTGEVRDYRIEVTDGSQPLRITMTFTDYPADSLANPARVNDVDLEVTTPTGDTYLGNAIDAARGESILGGAADQRNTTEMVLLSAPATGVYRLRVRGTLVAQGPKQGFAIVATGGVREAPSLQIRPTP